MELMRGRPVASSIDSQVKGILEGEDPVLSVYLIGGDSSSRIYARSKVRKGSSLGARVVLIDHDDDVEEDDLEGEIKNDSKDDEVMGIMIERPLPGHLSMERLMNMVPPEKDVEGLHPENYGSMAMGIPRFIPPTPLGALLMLKYYGVDTEGRSVSVIGRSPNVGRPVSILLSQKKRWGNATVTLVHSRTPDIESITKRSDIIITAAGIKGLIKGDMVRENSVIIDLGINPDGDSIVGDVDIGSMENMDVSVTPTPGGTGPVTVSAMFLNLALACMLRKGKRPVFEGMIREIYGTDQ